MGLSFRDILEIYRKSAFSERDKGSRFEILMQGYLRTDPMYAHLTEVWLWNEFPYRGQFSGKDTGIDLVAKTNQGEYWAIQCKCYQETSRIDKAEVDTFLSTSGKTFGDAQGQKVGFSERYWIATTDLWGEEAERAIENQTPPVNRIGISYLESAPVQWDKLHEGIFGKPSQSPKKILRPHQQEAVRKFSEHFQRAERGRLIMACGTGKTFTSLKIAEHETHGQGFILFLVPSIALLGQTLREWFSEAENPLQALCVCSDAEVSKRKSKAEDDASGRVEDLAMPATTDTITIKQRLKDKLNQKHHGLTVVFCTYQSIERVSDTQKDLIQEWQNEHPNGDNPYIFDLIICDEAHRTTGASLK
ncbi:MAG: DEAD/DEAH box helicase family protein, partial [Thermoguttaceae bacterium]|nr:DEAD/DEAH box helicase family protein [Thermoguttaceae bacterium]